MVAPVVAAATTPGGERLVVVAAATTPGGETLVVVAAATTPGGERLVVVAAATAPSGGTLVVVAAATTPGGERLVVVAAATNPGGGTLVAVAAATTAGGATAGGGGIALLAGSLTGLLGAINILGMPLLLGATAAFVFGNTGLMVSFVDCRGTGAFSFLQGYSSVSPGWGLDEPQTCPLLLLMTCSWSFPSRPTLEAKSQQPETPSMAMVEVQRWTPYFIKTCCAMTPQYKVEVGHFPLSSMG